MTKTRKTVDRGNVIARANAALAADIGGEAKVAVFTVTSGMLTTGNAYRGFAADGNDWVLGEWVSGRLDTFEAIRLGLVVRFL